MFILKIIGFAFMLKYLVRLIGVGLAWLDYFTENWKPNTRRIEQRREEITAQESSE